MGGVFGRRLRAARVATGFYNADDFAQVLGMAPAKYRRFEGGDAEPDLTELQQISEILSRSIDWLVRGVGM